MKNRRNIVEQQNPPQNPNDIWLKDGKFYRSTSEGWTVIDSELEYTNKEAMTADNPKGGTIGIDKESGEPSIYNDVTKQWSPLGGGVTETTWQELKDKRDAGKLTPGALYRITDYQCTTTQENTRSAGHQFDIVLLALSANKLAEEGWAMMHDNIYDVTFKDGVIKKCYWYPINESYANLVDVETLIGMSGVEVNGSEAHVDEINKTIDVSNIENGYSSTELTEENFTYNYFQNSNLSAWKVWYCIDNDKSRFAWADDSVDEDVDACINGKYYRNDTYDTTRDGVTYYCWRSKAQHPTEKYTKNTSPQIGDAVYKQQFQRMKMVMVDDGVVEEYTSGHKGKSIKESIVIDSLDDLEFYDTGERDTIDNVEYKAFKAKGNNLVILVHNLEVGSDVYIVSNTLPPHGNESLEVSLEKFGTIIKHTPEKLAYNGRGVIYRLIDEFNNDIKYDFKNIQFKRTITNGQYDANGTETWCYTLNVWYNNMCQDASIVGNTLPNAEGYISGVYDNVFGYAAATFVLGDNVVLSFYDDIVYFGIFSNTIGNCFHSNTIGNDFHNNTIGNNFHHNKVGNNVYSNIIGNDFINITISDDTSDKNYGNNGVELATKNDLN